MVEFSWTFQGEVSSWEREGEGRGEESRNSLFTVVMGVLWKVQRSIEDSRKKRRKILWRVNLFDTVVDRHVGF